MVTNTNHTSSSASIFSWFLILPFLHVLTSACTWTNSGYNTEALSLFMLPAPAHVELFLLYRTAPSKETYNQRRTKRKSRGRKDRERADPCCWLLDHRVEFAYVLSTVKEFYFVFTAILLPRGCSYRSLPFSSSRFLSLPKSVWEMRSCTVRINSPTRESHVMSLP